MSVVLPCIFEVSSVDLPLASWLDCTFGKPCSGPPPQIVRQVGRPKPPQLPYGI